MGVVFRQSVKSTIITFFGAALGAVLVLVSTNMIPKQELGFRVNLTNQVVVASFFIMMGMGNTLFFYFHRFDAEKEHKRRSVFMAMCFLVPLIVFILCTILYFGFQDFLLHYFQEKDRVFMKRYVYCFPLYTLFYLYIALLEAYMHTQIKTAAPSFVREVLLKGIQLLLVLLYGFRVIDFTVFIYSFVFTTLIAVLVLWLLARKNNSFRFDADWSVFSRKEYKEMFHFSGYHAMMGVTLSLIGFLGAILLAGLNHDGLNAVPIYTNAEFISGVMTIPYRAMNTSASADISKAYAQQDHEKVKDIYGRSALNIFIATTFTMLIIICNLHNAVALMVNGYEAVYGVTLILVLGKLADCGTGQNDVALNMSPHYRLNFFFSVILVLLMIIMFRLWIPKFGVYGAAWVFSLSVIGFNVVKTYVVHKRMDLQPFSKGTLIVLLITAVTAGIVFCVPHLSSPYWDTILRSILIVVLYASMTFWLKPSKDVSHYINETLKKKKLF